MPLAITAARNRYEAYVMADAMPDAPRRTYSYQVVTGYKTKSYLGGLIKRKIPIYKTETSTVLDTENYEFILELRDYGYQKNVKWRLKRGK